MKKKNPQCCLTMKISTIRTQCQNRNSEIIGKTNTPLSLWRYVGVRETQINGVDVNFKNKRGN